MMAEMKALNQSAFDWFHDKPAEHWSRSHFNEHPKCDMLLNNICETFNSNILEVREKPIITIIEWMREYVMKMLQVNRDRAEAKWKSRVCPKIRTILDKHTRKIRKRANVNSQSTACNPRSSGTGMRTLLPHAQQPETEDEETLSHYVGPLNQPQSEMIPSLRVPGPSMFNQLHMSRGTTSSNVPAQSVQKGLHLREQIRAPSPMNIQGAQFSTSMNSSIPYSSMVQPTIIGRRKFVNLSSLASTQVSQTRENTGDN
ncbi:hypothetical protein BUALT_Bualt19G0015300 [Buddleja alternifolia]|uniref:Uncharacterized protein n=1 Tax=Buddleja alternifolia TaxID=168488 RepID=A0AAV6W8T4_9LAMI|nr:hypothetical protein BUALT_Bualt19G0015300 [Buddleja alternifolia]